jgi:hypothetical protein
MVLIMLFVGAPTLGGCPVLPDNHIFNQSIADVPVHPQSQQIMDLIGTAAIKLHLDLGQTVDTQSDQYYGIPYNIANASTLTWKKVDYTDGSPDESECGNGDASNGLTVDCENVAHPTLPIPDNPLVEAGTHPAGFDDEDHHILVLDTAHCQLWEAYHAYTTASGWTILSSAFFDMRSNTLRTAKWTSADATGFPIMPLLLKAAEAASGTIAHALRFTIPSNKIAPRYEWPATHLTKNGPDTPANPSMGQLFRLKASYTIPASYGTQSKAILQAMKTYGMYLADGGSAMYVTGEPNAAWDDAILDEVQKVTHKEFEVVDTASIKARPGFDVHSAALPGAPAGDPGAPGTGASDPNSGVTPPASTNPGGTMPGTDSNTTKRGCQAVDSSAPFELVLCLGLLLRRARHVGQSSRKKHS